LTRKVFHGDGNTNDGNDELADTHSNSSYEKEPATTETFDTPDARKGHADVDNIGRNSNKETVADARVLEEGCAIVEDEVDCERRVEGIPAGKDTKNLLPVSCCQA
jgi:hypothetical protein